MPIMEPGPGWQDAAWAFGAAAAGRVSLMVRIKRQAVTLRGVLWVLFWELPVTSAMAFLGYGLANWLDLKGGAAIVLIALLARKGPDIVDPVLESLVPALRRAKS